MAPTVVDCEERSTSFSVRRKSPTGRKGASGDDESQILKQVRSVLRRADSVNSQADLGLNDDDAGQIFCARLNQKRFGRARIVEISSSEMKLRRRGCDRIGGKVEDTDNLS